MQHISAGTGTVTNNIKQVPIFDLRKTNLRPASGGWEEEALLPPMKPRPPRFALVYRSRIRHHLDRGGVIQR
jgi:hypothetical protein